ncbi:MAG: acetyl-CoA carboxylase biotin carboxyl carrier protein subunit [Bacillota bacterium]
MDIKEIKKLVEVMCESSLTNLEIEQDGMKIKLEKTNGTVEVIREVSVPMQYAAPQYAQPVQLPQTPAPAASPVCGPDSDATPIAGTPVSNKGSKEVKAPMVGTFHDLTKNKIAAGSKVKAGDVLCIVEAMKLMNEISIPEAGEIVTVEVAEGDMVEFGQILFTYN